MQFKNVLRGLYALLLVLILTACQPASSATTTSDASSTQEPKGKTADNAGGSTIFDIVQADGTSQPFTLEQLKSLPIKSIMAGGKPQEGPAVLDVLASIGITDFQKVTIAGDGSLTFTRAEVTGEMILDLNNHGTVKLASPDLPIPSPVKEVQTITVE
ncbi:MAG: hypothetical protein U0175_23980 [Caldilineaceae bacterium]